jgi:molybdopterin-containing oxidoreductase family iron-sulfur binding subunit
MKRVWQHPEEPKTGRRYWRSMGELEQREDFLKNLGREFPNGDELTEEERENSRRTFLKIMGASVGMMGLASCRRPTINILPFTKSVEWVVPGKPLLYATAMPRAFGATPLVVTTHEGRPTHLSGNPLHPGVSGGLDAFAQSSILDLYDPDRSQKILIDGKKADAAALDKALENLKKSAATDGLAILVGQERSPTADALRAEVLKKFPKAKLYSHEAISRDTQAAVNASLLGVGVQTVVNLDNAHRVLSLDCDFLGLEPVSDDSVAQFSKNRSADKPDEAEQMSRLYVLENRYTLTGAMADHRKALAASQLSAAAALLAAKIDPALAGSVAALAATATPELQKWVETAAEDLLANKGKAVVLAGSRTDAAVQALAVAVNNALGAYGPIIEAYKVEGNATGSIKDLADAVAAGSVKTLISVTAADVVYDAPASLNLAKSLKDKKVVLVHLGVRLNATARAANIHVPAAHYLEAWGDVVSQTGVYSIVQPMIQPLFGGFSEIELLLALVDKKKFAAEAPKAGAVPTDDPAYVAVRESFAKAAGGASEEKWNFTLRDGFLKGSQAKPVAATVNTSGVATFVSAAKPAPSLTATSPEIVLVPDSSVFDGRYINNGWLQEAPDPVTKLTWDNAALIGSATYKALGLVHGQGADEGLVQKIKITVGGNELVIPAIEAPGHVSNSITIPLGYGQDNPGNVGKGSGFNGYTLLSNPNEFVLTGAKVEVLSDRYQLAITQEHNSMEGRSVYREGTTETLKENPTFAQTTGIDSHIPPAMSFYKGQFGEKQDYSKTKEEDEGFDYKTKHQWGMTIDLSKCIGCTACLLACQSENNIPIVGKDQVTKGRVMHWIRMDRYFATSEVGVEKRERDDVDVSATPEQLENAEMVHQPVACQQCESAPCETVCPVNATVHTDEGLNAMAYNRCIGTRYCANNCPYTARRFNWFDYNKRPLDELYWGPLSTPEKTGMREITKLQKNPNVTVRMRGVIEKCTYCVQRIESAKITQIQKQRDSKDFRVPTDSVKSACQQACPAGAIEFGDLANKDSKVLKLKASNRNYDVLKYLNTRPRTSYLARIRNVNPKMPGAAGIAAWSGKNF